MKGEVFDVQRYSIHDGPGIRTTVFLKGCPLKCKWCANPESQNKYPEIFFRSQICEGCGRCVEICPQNAISLVKDFIDLDRILCDRCMKCIEKCPTKALSITGETRTTEEIVDIVMKDELFYNNSGGGLTISGGEPLLQPDFTLDLLKACKDKSIHTTLDTSGHARWEILESMVNYSDLILFDIKHLNSDQHIAGTGVGNELILQNLKKITEKGNRLWVRIPIIPGYNDSAKHIEDIAKFLSKMPIEKVSMLAFHEWSKSKYKALGIYYPCKDLSPIEEEKIHPLKNIFESFGMEITIGY